MMNNVPGIALVTGAASGIGRATALAFAHAGAAGILIADINYDGLTQVASELSAAATSPDFKVSTFKVDISQEEQIIQMVNQAVDVFGRLDYAVNVAGIPEQKRATADLSSAQYDRVVAINQRGTFLCMREELRVMKSQDPVERLPGRPALRGAITNVSSVLGLRGLEGFTSYVSSKHAVIGMTKTAAACHASDGIRVNAMCPGFVQTPLISDMADTVETQNALKAVLETVLQKRLAQPEEVADVILFMTSEYASFVTGAAWRADGGYHVA